MKSFENITLLVWFKVCFFQCRTWRRNIFLVTFIRKSRNQNQMIHNSFGDILSLNVSYNLWTTWLFLFRSHFYLISAAIKKFKPELILTQITFCNKKTLTFFTSSLTLLHRDGKPLGGKKYAHDERRGHMNYLSMPIYFHWHLVTYKAFHFP